MIEDLDYQLKDTRKPSKKNDVFVGKWGYVRKLDITHVGEVGNKDAKTKFLPMSSRKNEDYFISSLTLENNNKIWGALSKPKSVSNIYEHIFNSLSKKWKKQTLPLSDLVRITENESYKSIIDLGEVVVPFILRDLEKTYSYWFTALEKITEQNPVSDEDFGDIPQMTKVWLDWGRKKNKI